MFLTTNTSYTLTPGYIKEFNVSIINIPDITEYPGYYS